MRALPFIAGALLLTASLIGPVAAEAPQEPVDPVEVFCARLEQLGESTRLLQMLVGLGLIKEPQWSEAERIYRRSSGGLDVTSRSFNVPETDAIECVVLMSRSSAENRNPAVRAVTIQTPRELITYHLRKEGYAEAFRSRRDQTESRDQ